MISTKNTSSTWTFIAGPNQPQVLHDLQELRSSDSMEVESESDLMEVESDRFDVEGARSPALWSSVLNARATLDSRPQVQHGSLPKNAAKVVSKPALAQKKQKKCQDLTDLLLGGIGGKTKP